MSVSTARSAYKALSLARFSSLMTGADDSLRWRLIAEFLEDYRHEPAGIRFGLLEAEPGETGDDRWDVFLAALGEHLAARDGRAAPAWAERRVPRQLWFRSVPGLPGWMPWCMRRRLFAGVASMWRRRN